jgi:hypothetical protein
MATRSAIAIKVNENEFKSIYCHFDGYLFGVGQTLLDHYDYDKTNELINLGDLSSLGSKLGEEHDFNNCPNDICNFYGRDRKEKDVGFATHSSIGQLVKARNHLDYIYLFDTEWYLVNNDGKKTLVKEYL